MAELLSSAQMRAIPAASSGVAAPVERRPKR